MQPSLPALRKESSLSQQIPVTPLAWAPGSATRLVKAIVVFHTMMLESSEPVASSMLLGHLSK